MLPDTSALNMVLLDIPYEAGLGADVTVLCLVSPEHDGWELVLGCGIWGPAYDVLYI